MRAGRSEGKSRRPALPGSASRGLGAKPLQPIEFRKFCQGALGIANRTGGKRGTACDIKDVDILSRIQGLSYSLTDLYQEIANHGWQVKKVSYDSKLDRFVATATTPHGDEMSMGGPTDQLAVTNLLFNVIARNNVRMSKLSMWRHTFTEQLKAIAEAYSKAPLYEPKAAYAFMELGRDSQHRARALQDHLEINIVNDPEPYKSPDKMFDDIRKRRRLDVSRAGSDHPIWSTEQVIAYRVVHDVLGHAASGGGWDWEGENRAFAAHAALVPAEAQKALFTESIANAAYASYYRAYGPQKVALFSQFMDEAQERENPSDNHRGVHPSQSRPPGEKPAVKPILGHLDPDARILRKTAQEPGGSLTDPNEGWQSGVGPLPINAGMDMGDPLGALPPPQLDSPEESPLYANARLINSEWSLLNQQDPAELQTMKLAITNAFRVVLLSPQKDLKWNAVHYQDIAKVDPNVSDPTKYWHTLEKRRQEWNVERFGEKARYQHLPYNDLWRELEHRIYQKDPEAGWEAAVQKADRRIFAWRTDEENKVRDEEADLPEDKRSPGFRVELEANQRLVDRLERYLKPSLADADSAHMAAGKKKDKKETNLCPRCDGTGMDFKFQGNDVPCPTCGGTGKYIRDKKPRGPKRNPETPSAPRLSPQQMGLGEEQGIDTPFVPTPPKPEKYGAFMGGHLEAIAQISEHVDEILQAALYDVHEHKVNDQRGTGYHFRATVLSLNITGVGPKVCSFAWLLLQPMTSQLATIDRHMMRVLGYQENDINPRDYFKYERQLATGRDASGYGTVPLGLFQWGMWDRQRTGPGTHQDHSAMRVLDPTPHSAVDWESKEGADGNVANEQWWLDTLPYRQSVGEQWDNDVARRRPKNHLPYGATPQAVFAKTAVSYLTPYFTHPQTGEEVMGQPGQTIMQHMRSVGLNLSDAWAIEEAGKR